LARRIAHALRVATTAGAAPARSAPGRRAYALASASHHERTMLRVMLGVSLLASCVRVRPHEREQLAHPAMQGMMWPSLDRADQHVFAVREGTEGATVEGGGGCGCN
jgi:hypothetical protein